MPTKPRSPPSSSAVNRHDSRVRFPIISPYVSVRSFSCSSTNLALAASDRLLGSSPAANKFWGDESQKYSIMNAAAWRIDDASPDEGTTLMSVLASAAAGTGDASVASSAKNILASVVLVTDPARA